MKVGHWQGQRKLFKLYMHAIYICVCVYTSINPVSSSLSLPTCMYGYVYILMFMDTSLYIYIYNRDKK